MRLYDVNRIAAAESLDTADRHRQVDALARNLLEPRLEGHPLRAPRGIRANRFVAGFGNGRDRVHTSIVARMNATAPIDSRGGALADQLDLDVAAPAGVTGGADLAAPAARSRESG